MERPAFPPVHTHALAHAHPPQQSTHDALLPEDESHLPSLRQLFPEHVRMEAANALYQQQQLQQQQQQRQHQVQMSHQSHQQQPAHGSPDMHRPASYSQMQALHYAAQHIANQNPHSPPPPSSQLSHHMVSSQPNMYHYAPAPTVAAVAAPTSPLPTGYHQHQPGPDSSPTGEHTNTSVSPPTLRSQSSREPDPASKYDCPYCGKRFDRPSSVKIHITSHTGEKPYVCPFPGCGRRFSVNSNMRRHLRTHAPHSATMSSFPEQAEIDDDDAASVSSRRPVLTRRATTGGYPASSAPSMSTSIQLQPAPSHPTLGQTSFGPGQGQFQLSPVPDSPSPSATLPYQTQQQHSQQPHHHHLAHQHQHQQHHYSSSAPSHAQYGGYQHQQHYPGYGATSPDHHRWLQSSQPQTHSVHRVD